PGLLFDQAPSAISAVPSSSSGADGSSMVRLKADTTERQTDHMSPEDQECSSKTILSKQSCLLISWAPVRPSSLCDLRGSLFVVRCRRLLDGPPEGGHYRTSDGSHESRRPGVFFENNFVQTILSPDLLGSCSTKLPLRSPRFPLRRPVP